MILDIDSQTKGAMFPMLFCANLFKFVNILLIVVKRLDNQRKEWYIIIVSTHCG